MLSTRVYRFSYVGKIKLLCSRNDKTKERRSCPVP
jgi:hypothetical protein